VVRHNISPVWWQVFQEILFSSEATNTVKGKQKLHVIHILYNVLQSHASDNNVTIKKVHLTDLNEDFQGSRQNTYINRQDSAIVFVTF
jgi:glutaredoxin-related protein